MSATELWRASILHFLDDPDIGESSWEYFEDGALVVRNGVVVECGAAHNLLAHHPNSRVHDCSGRLIVPGFVDVHTHYPQFEVMGHCGSQLLEWLENYTFPAEAKYIDPEYAGRMAQFFLDQCLLNGTTTAMVFCTVSPSSVDAFFQAAEVRRMRMIAGKVMMDRNAPANLLDTAESSYRDSKALIERWHGRDRLGYAVTPRFAPTSTPEQLQAAARLLDEFDNVYLQTHLAENRQEIEWVKSLFPDCREYHDVYRHFRLLRKRTVLAHSIHLSDDGWDCIADSGASVAFCAGSNLFLGSGVFDCERCLQHGVPVGLGTDVGAGPSPSVLGAMKDAYQVAQLQGFTISPLKLFYLATLGGAKVLGLDDTIGSFKKGREADFLVLNRAATPLLKFRTGGTKTLAELLGVLLALGDDRIVEKTVILGKPTGPTGRTQQNDRG